MGKDILQSFNDTGAISTDLDLFFNNIFQASAIGVAAMLIVAPLISYYQYSRLVQQDLNRAGEGLPIEVEITPEEIGQTPELEEIYGASADDGFLVFVLESNEQYLRNQYIANLLFNYINNHLQAEQLWELYSTIESILDNLL